MKAKPNYNTQFLRDGETTDEEVREELLTLYPHWDIPEETMHTTGFVPNIIKNQWYENVSQLTGKMNPTTNEVFTDKTAKREADKLASNATKVYRNLLKSRGK